MDTQLEAFGFHGRNPYGVVPKEVTSKFATDGQLLWGAVYRVPSLRGIEPGELEQIGVPRIRELHIAFYPSGTTVGALDDSGNTVDRRVEDPCVRILVGTGEADVTKAAERGKENLRMVEAVLCLCLEGIPLEEVVFEGFFAPGSKPGTHLQLVARQRVRVKGFRTEQLKRKLQPLDAEIQVGVRRSLQWFQSAYWERDKTARFAKCFLAILAIIEDWSEQNQKLIPLTEERKKNTHPRTWARAYITHRLNLRDQVEPVCECFDRVYKARNRVLHSALRDRITDGLLQDAEALTVSMLQFELFGYFKEKRFPS